jgi:SPX domain protein involved in polyphosphate accumulation
MPLQKFERYEFKYILDTIQRNKIENDVKNFMELDEFAKKNKNYFVRSLYFDDPNYVNYYEKIDGMKLRHKFRLRTYGKDYCQDVPIFLEVKGRVNQRTYKKRIKIEKKNLFKYEGSESNIMIEKDELSNSLINFFVYEKLKKNIKPLVLTDYNRSPYVSNYDRNFRVTFDKNLIIQKTDKLFENNNSFARNCLTGYTILEVKFDRRMPKWFHRIIQTYNLNRLSISKFCVGMERIELVENLE